MNYYFSVDKNKAKAAEAAIFIALRNQTLADDPDAIAKDGTLIGRNAATGELDPDATRTTSYSGEPLEVAGGWAIPVPEAPALQLQDPSALGVALRSDPVRIRRARPGEEIRITVG